MKIAVIGGDGTGPEVTQEAIKVLDAVSKLEGFTYETTDFDFGGERYLKTGDILPEGAVDALKQHDAIYLGAVGHRHRQCSPISRNRFFANAAHGPEVITQPVRKIWLVSLQGPEWPLAHPSRDFPSAYT